MGLLEEFDGLETVFIDTAPIIYYIEAHPQFGPLMKDIVGALESKSIKAYSSVITLTEVLPKPVKLGRRELVKRFTYLTNDKKLKQVEEVKIICMKDYL